MIDLGDRLPEMVAAVRAAADNPEHAWDKRALEWDISAESVVYEVGAYQGRWALQMARRYNPQLYCFEPQEWAARVCCAVLEPYTAQVFQFGLGDRDARLPMARYGTDGCEMGVGGDVFGRIRDIVAVVRELKTPDIDLMLINIEGGEFALLPHMLRNGIIPRQLMVQFHDYGNPQPQIEARKLLAEQYVALWDYGTVLSAWRRKGWYDNWASANLPEVQAF